jgi:hypothetical protein
MKVGTGFVILGQNYDQIVPVPVNTALVRVYNESTNGAIYPTLMRAAKSAIGIVTISGFLRVTGTPVSDGILATLPVGYRPDTDLFFPVNINATVAGTVRIKPDGTVRMYTAFPVNSYISIEGMSFPAAGAATWTPITTWGANFEAWPAWEAQYGAPGYWKDPYGFMWFRGLARVKVTTSTDNTMIFTLAGGLVADKHQHIRTASNGVFGNVQFAPDGVRWKTGSSGVIGDWTSLAGIIGVTADARANNTWTEAPAFSNSWANYGSTYPNAQYCLREDGLRILNGLIKTGTLGARAFTMSEEEFWPSRGRLILPTVSNLAFARFDIASARDPVADAIYPPGAIIPDVGSATWFSIDGKAYIP